MLGGAGLARGFGEKFASKLGGSNSGPNQVKIRSRPDLDPIWTRFRPGQKRVKNKDPISTWGGTQFFSLDPIWTRFRPDFDPIST